MTSYLITGASRGIGFSLLKNLSAHPSNTVIALVRSKAATDQKIASEIPEERKNIYILQGDITDVTLLKVRPYMLLSVQNVQKHTYIALGGRDRADQMIARIQAAFYETEKILQDTGKEGLDVLIANAGLISDYSSFLKLTELGQTPTNLESDFNALISVNVTGNIHLFNTFLPLLLSPSTTTTSKLKKVVTLSSGMSDMEMAIKYNLWENPLYSISKAAVNMVIAKYQAEFGEEGERKGKEKGNKILFMGVCPGSVDTGHMVPETLSPHNQSRMAAMGAKFQTYAPHFAGWAQPDDAAKDVLRVLEHATIEKNGGRTVSHFGTDRWL